MNELMTEARREAERLYALLPGRVIHGPSYSAFVAGANWAAKKAWDEGFDACANWWEIHHHGVVRDDSNPYTPESLNSGKDPA